MFSRCQSDFYPISPFGSPSILLLAVMLIAVMIYFFRYIPVFFDSHSDSVSLMHYFFACISSVNFINCFIILPFAHITSPASAVHILLS